MNLPFQKSATKPVDGAPAKGKRCLHAFKEIWRAKKTRKRAIAGLLALVVVCGAAGCFLSGRKQENTASYAEQAVKRQDIQKQLSATGTLAPVNQYNVTTLAKGEVTSCTFEEGDVVEQDQLLYQIDSSDAQNNVEKTRISLEQSRLSYDSQLEDLGNLQVKAKKNGVITAVNVSVGDKVQSGAKIAELRDSSTMLLEVPFNTADANTFHVGQRAVVSVDGSFETLSGTVQEIDGAETVLAGYQTVKYVTIAVTNPGALSPLAAGTAAIGGVACNSGANFAYNEETTITAETAGEVTALPVSAGSKVSEDSLVAVLSSTSLQNQVKNAEFSLKNAELSLQNTIDTLDNYNVTAPIAGTVVTKNVQAGDSIDSSSGITTLAVIYDMSALTFEIALDELDISLVSVGQEVEITADALTGQTFTGYITKVSVAGTTSNGATTYPVTVQIDNPPAELLPGMNVNASIIVAESENTLSVPVAAVQRGSIVYVKDNNASHESQAVKADTQEASKSDMGHQTTGSEQVNNVKTKNNTAPEGFKAVQVEVGISNDDYIEITSGLNEGDIVYVPVATRTSSEKTNQDSSGMGGGDMGGMGGTMPAGGGEFAVAGGRMP